MEPEISLTLGASLLIALGSIYCCINTRRVNSLERRIRNLEEKETVPQPVVRPTPLPTSYYPPTNYTQSTYYQPQPTAPPQMYYPQQGPVL